MSSKLQALKEAHENLQARFREEGQGVLREAFAEIFEAYPECGSIYWTQYAPYFNDGEPCVFSVHSFSTESPEEMAERIETESELEDKWIRPDQRDKLYWAVEELYQLCHSLPDLMKAAFTEECQVLATRAGFEVSECNHD